MREYEIVVSRTAEKELSSLSPELRSRISAAIDSLQTRPRAPGITKVRGRLQTYRLRVGDYRIIYVIDDKRGAVDIVYIRHRREAYR